MELILLAVPLIVFGLVLAQMAKAQRARRLQTSDSWEAFGEAHGLTLTGEIYGLDHTPERFEQDWLKPKTRLPGLYLTGQDIMTCGVVGAMIGGLLTTVAVSGLKGLPLAKKMFVG